MSFIFGDQDLLNIYFALYPEQMYALPCQMNFRLNHCASLDTTCPGLVERGSLPKPKLGQNNGTLLSVAAGDNNSCSQGRKRDSCEDVGNKEEEVFGVSGPVIAHGFISSFHYKPTIQALEDLGYFWNAIELVLGLLVFNLSRIKVHLMYMWFPKNIPLMIGIFDAISGYEIGGDVTLSDWFLREYSRLEYHKSDFCKELIPTVHSLFRNCQFDQISK